jgi:hypothetical protein
LSHCLPLGAFSQKPNQNKQKRKPDSRTLMKIKTNHKPNTQLPLQQQQTQVRTVPSYIHRQ